MRRSDAHEPDMRQWRSSQADAMAGLPILRSSAFSITGQQLHPFYPRRHSQWAADLGDLVPLLEISGIPGGAGRELTGFGSNPVSSKAGTGRSAASGISFASAALLPVGEFGQVPVLGLPCRPGFGPYRKSRDFGITLRLRGCCMGDAAGCLLAPIAAPSGAGTAQSRSGIRRSSQPVRSSRDCATR